MFFGSSGDEIPLPEELKKPPREYGRHTEEELLTLHKEYSQRLYKIHSELMQRGSYDFNIHGWEKNLGVPPAITVIKEY